MISDNVDITCYRASANNIVVPSSNKHKITQVSNDPFQCELYTLAGRGCFNVQINNNNNKKKCDDRNNVIYF